MHPGTLLQDLQQHAGGCLLSAIAAAAFVLLGTKEVADHVLCSMDRKQDPLKIAGASISCYICAQPRSSVHILRQCACNCSPCSAQDPCHSCYDIVTSSLNYVSREASYRQLKAALLVRITSARQMASVPAGGLFRKCWAAMPR